MYNRGFMRSSAGLLLAATLVLGGAVPVARADPGAATVMIRVFGEVTAALGPDTGAWRPSAALREVQIGTGSGFVISSGGYILTNSHVIRGGRLKVAVDGQPVEITMSVQAISVVVAPTAAEPGPPRTFAATVVADDPSVDLAVLSVGSQDLPVAPLGDALTLQRGDAVSAWGYPLGDRLAVEGAAGSELPPVSASAGTVSALRDGGAAGLPPTVPYVQFTAPINPGNSGGPLVDRDGYVVGIVQAKLQKAEGVAFAISVEEVKRFLERNGLDAALPVHTLQLGPVFELPEKGVRMRLPAGFVDQSAARTRVDGGASTGAIRLVIDRVASAWDPARLEQALLEGRAFGQGTFTALPDRLRVEQARGRWRLGLAERRGDAADSRMVHVVLALGEDVLVARYVGPADEVAFNLSTLRDSLLSMDAATFVPRPVAAAVPARVGTLSVEGTPADLLPAGTVLDGSAPGACGGGPEPRRSAVAVLAADFTVRFAARRWPAGVSAADIARACGVGAQRWTQFGLAWAGERTVVTTSEGEPVLLDVWAPATKIGFARDAFLAWTRAVAGAP